MVVSFPGQAILGAVLLMWVGVILVKYRAKVLVKYKYTILRLLTKDFSRSLVKIWHQICKLCVPWPLATILWWGTPPENVMDSWWGTRIYAFLLNDLEFT